MLPSQERRLDEIANIDNHEALAVALASQASSQNYSSPLQMSDEIVSTSTYEPPPSAQPS